MLWLVAPLLRTLSAWDGVFVDQALASLHRSGVALVTEGWTGSIIDRHEREPQNALEEAVCSVLDACSDDARYVEYWWREHHCSMAVHRDIDEALNQLMAGFQRCPRYGHVLYVDVDEGLCAPTLLWHEEALAEPVSDMNRAGAPRRLDALTVVPAVPGRLLRFDGATLHSVPPLLKLDEGADEPASMAPRLRSVLLFNSWDEAPMDYQLGELPPGDPEVPSSAQPSAQPQPLCCSPLIHWEQRAIVPLGRSSRSDARRGSELVRVSAPLLGEDAVRRGCDADVLDGMATCSEGLLRALGDTRDVHVLDLLDVDGDEEEMQAGARTISL